MGSGGGSQTTTTVDPVYNAGLLALSQEQQGWAGEMFNMFKYGVNYDPNEVVYTDANGKVYSKQEAAAIQGQANPALAQYNQQIDNLMYPDGRTAARSDNGLEGQIKGGQKIFPRMTREQAIAQLTAQGITQPDPYTIAPGALTETTRGSVSGYDPNAQTSEMDYLQQVVNSNASLLGLQTDISKAQLESQKALIPQQTAAIQQRLGLATTFMNDAEKGIDTNARMNQAQADVQHGFKNARETMAKNLGSYGLDPNSGMFASQNRDLALSEASGIAGARTAAKNQAEAEDFARKQQALQVNI